MNNQEWISIACIVLGFILVTNFGIIKAFRKNKSKGKGYGEVINRLIKIHQNPWAEQNAQLNELAALVDKLKEDEGNDPG